MPHYSQSINARFPAEVFSVDHFRVAPTVCQSSPPRREFLVIPGVQLIPVLTLILCTPIFIPDFLVFPAGLLFPFQVHLNALLRSYGRP